MPREDRDKQTRPSEAHEHAYKPADGTDWTDPDPKTVGEALDTIAGAPPGAGDVVGPAGATDLAIAIYDGVTGKLVKNSAVIIDNNGKVGIGTVSPDELLHIVSAAATSAHAKIEAPSGYKATLQLYEASDYGFEFEYNGATDKLHLWSRTFIGNEAIRMTWLKTGYVGIGEDTPTEILDVVGNIKVSGTVDGVDVGAHVTDTTTHGTTGDIVGTTDTQTLTNKTAEDLTIKDCIGFDEVHDNGNVSGEVTVNWNNGGMQEATLIGDVTGLAFTNPPKSGLYHLLLIQDGTGGREVVWDDVDYWIRGGRKPVVSTAADALDWFHFMFDGTLWYGVQQPNFAAPV